MSLAFAYSLDYLPGNTSSDLDNAPIPCGMELIWPPSDAVILIAPDSHYIMIYVKLSGNCAEFLGPQSSTGPRFDLGYRVLYHNIDGRDSVDESMSFSLKPSQAFLLKEDKTPVHSRLMRSPSLGEPNEESDVWAFDLVYSFRNFQGVHEPERLFAELSIYPITDPSLSQLSAVLRFSTLGFSSTQFSRIALRYNTIAGYMCSESLSPYNLESPICTPVAAAADWTLAGPSFTLHGYDAGSTQKSQSLHHPVVNFTRLCMKAVPIECRDEIAFVSIGGSSLGYGHEIGVVGPGRHRLLSVVAAVLTDSVGFIFLKTNRVHMKQSRIVSLIRKFDLSSSYPFVAFRHRRLGPIQSAFEEQGSPETFISLPTAEFGSIDDGILLSRAAAELMLTVSNLEAARQQNETLPAACSEFLIFSDAWLCWCASSIGIPAINMQFRADDLVEGTSNRGECAVASSLYGKLAQMYELQRLSLLNTVSLPFTERTTLGFRCFMQTLAFHLAAGPHILHIPDDEDRGDSLFWDDCAGQLLINHMLPELQPEHTGLHPLLQDMWGALAAAPNRSSFIATLRTAFVADAMHGRASVNASMHATRRRIRMSVSAARVLGCSSYDIDALRVAHGDLFHGSSGFSASKPLELNIILPAVMLSKYSRPVSRRLYLSTHSNWSSVFGYNPAFSKDASMALAAPEFSIQDWYAVCTLAVSSITDGEPAFDAQSRADLACGTFASAVWQRVYAAGMPRCVDLPSDGMNDARNGVYANCLLQNQVAGREKGEVNDDPWMLRQLAEAVRALLQDRWDFQQVSTIPQQRVILYILTCFVHLTLLCACRAGLKHRFTCIAS